MKLTIKVVISALIVMLLDHFEPQIRIALNIAQPTLRTTLDHNFVFVFFSASLLYLLVHLGFSLFKKFSKEVLHEVWLILIVYAAIATLGLTIALHSPEHDHLIVTIILMFGPIVLPFVFAELAVEYVTMVAVRTQKLLPKS